MQEKLENVWLRFSKSYDFPKPRFLIKQVESESAATR